MEQAPKEEKALSWKKEKKMSKEEAERMSDALVKVSAAPHAVGFWLGQLRQGKEQQSALSARNNPEEYGKSFLTALGLFDIEREKYAKGSGTDL